MNPETPQNPTPEVPVQTDAPTPFPAAAPLDPQQPTTPQIDPPKKSRKKLFIILGVALTLIVAGIVTALLVISNITSQAKEAAATYTKAAEDHVTLLIDVKVFKDRLDNYKTRPTLAKVSMGETFSKEYKDAVALQAKYNALLDDTYSAVAERYATLELSPFFKEFAAKLAIKLDTASFNVTDETSLAAARKYIVSLENKSKDYTELATRYKSYVYAEKYQSYQKKAADALQGMADSWGELAKVATTYVDLSEKFLAAEKSQNKDEVTKLAAEVTKASTEIKAKTTEINANYKDYATILGANNKLLVNTIVADGYLNTAYTKSSEVLDKLVEFQKSLKK